MTKYSEIQFLKNTLKINKVDDSFYLRLVISAIEDSEIYHGDGMLKLRRLENNYNISIKDGRLIKDIEKILKKNT
jgi:hypothetical protein